MHEIGGIHIGDMINVFRHGSLVMQNLGDSNVPHHGSILYGTVQGAIGKRNIVCIRFVASLRYWDHRKDVWNDFFLFSGLVTQLAPEFFSFLQDLQNRMKKIRSVGKIQHSSWRSFYNERKTEPMEGFIDGDLVETFLDLDRHVMEEIVSGMQGRDIMLLLVVVI